MFGSPAKANQPTLPDLQDKDYPEDEPDLVVDEVPELAKPL